VEIERSRQKEVEESDAYSLFKYAVRSQITRDYYLRRLRIFLTILVYFQKELWKKGVIYLHRKEKRIQVGHLAALLDSDRVAPVS
jgi:hypothetical protein